MKYSAEFQMGQITEAVKDIRDAILDIKDLVKSQDKRIAALEAFRWLLAGAIAVMSFLATWIYNWVYNYITTTHK